MGSQKQVVNYNKTKTHDIHHTGNHGANGNA